MGGSDKHSGVCINRCVSLMSREKTPFELWTLEKPDLSHIRIFGSIAYAHITKESRKKFDAKSKKCVLVGYQGDSKNYRLYDPSADKVIVSRDVIFNETINAKSENDNGSVVTIKSEAIENNENAIDRQAINDDSFLDYEDANDEVQQANVKENPKSYELRNHETIKAPNRYSACFAFYNEPKTYQEAMQSKDSDKWRDAIDEELKAHERNKTWELLPLPENKNIIGCKWVFKIKENPNTSEVRYKARLCAKGYSQKEGFDYNEVFSPVVRYDVVLYEFS